MKEVKMFMMETCPHCRKALSLMEEICAEHPEYKTVEIKMTDETKEPEYAGKFDYYYVPTYFVGEAKIHEGVPSREAIEKVYEEAVK
ncbi:MAG: thioredoxin family protein [Synergistaceae bacterium]|jgi:glutaredoxin|nr:thioredoxin family protein [Synergistaceae bacterium]